MTSLSLAAVRQPLIFRAEAERTMLEESVASRTRGGLTSGFLVLPSPMESFIQTVAHGGLRGRELWVQGQAVPAIADELNAEELGTTRDVPLSNSSIRSIIENQSYIGTYHHGGYVIESGMPTIVDKELFDAAQAKPVSDKSQASQPAKPPDTRSITRIFIT